MAIQTHLFMAMKTITVTKERILKGNVGIFEKCLECGRWVHNFKLFVFIAHLGNVQFIYGIARPFHSSKGFQLTFLQWAWRVSKNLIFAARSNILQSAEYPCITLLSGNPKQIYMKV